MQTIEIAQIDDKGYFSELINNIRSESQQLADDMLSSNRRLQKKETEMISLDKEIKKVVKDLEQKEENNEAKYKGI